MTFKHVKFEDSVVMRSLEKLAKEKGLVKPEKITKTAAVKTDLTATANLMQNILNLCAGLRQSGFTKHANELEEKFMVYKQAQTLYETTKETGEDLVESAHSKGSHKLEDVDSDEAVFETIVDQHMKHLKMIEKAPTGKLASARNVIDAVKVVLGEEALGAAPVQPTLSGNEDQDLAAYHDWVAYSYVLRTMPILNKGWKIITKQMSTTTLKPMFAKNYNEINQKINSLTQDNVGIDDLKSIFTDLNDIQASINAFNPTDAAALTPAGFMPTVTKHLGDAYDAATLNWGGQFRDQLTELITEAKSNVNVAIDSLSGKKDTVIKGMIEQSGSKSAIDSAKKMFTDWLAKVATVAEATPPEKQLAVNWINKRLAAIEEIKNSSDDMAQKLSKLNAITADPEVQQFKSTWIV